MKTKLIQFLQLSLCVTVLSFVPGCGSSNSDESSIELSKGVQLEMLLLPSGLWFGKYEVTQAQWETLMGENPSHFGGADNPVENVSWKDCQVFLKKLNEHPECKKSGLTFRLPTEEEWVFAFRAGSAGRYCRLANGTEITEKTLGEVAWFEDNANKQTHPVGRKKPNAFGLYDMSGNVCEWTSTADGEFRVYRGGCWLSSARNCEPSIRLGWHLLRRFDNLGFRLCAERKAD